MNLITIPRRLSLIIILALGLIGLPFARGAKDADGKRDWISKASVGGRAPNLSDLAGKVVIAPEFLSHARALITPGTTLILTDAPVSDRTRSGPGFNILTASQKK